MGTGLGLGLSIATEIVRLHGGSIDVTSEVGRGSQFRVTQPDTLLEETLSSLREQPEFDSIEVLRDALPEIVADNSQLRRLFQHLLLNAAQYAKPEAPAAIHISVERQGSEWLLTVANSNVDIPANKLEQVFETFTRLAGARGVGMDLALCRRIVTRHGGKALLLARGNKDQRYHRGLRYVLQPFGHKTSTPRHEN